MVEGDDTNRLSLLRKGKKIKGKEKQDRRSECGKGAGLRPTPEQ